MFPKICCLEHQGYPIKFITKTQNFEKPNRCCCEKCKLTDVINIELCLCLIDYLNSKQQLFNKELEKTQNQVDKIIKCKNLKIEQKYQLDHLSNEIKDFRLELLKMTKFFCFRQRSKELKLLDLQQMGDFLFKVSLNKQISYSSYYFNSIQKRINDFQTNIQNIFNPQQDTQDKDRIFQNLQHLQNLELILSYEIQDRIINIEFINSILICECLEKVQNLNDPNIVLKQLNQDSTNQIFQYSEYNDQIISLCYCKKQQLLILGYQWGIIKLFQIQKNSIIQRLDIQQEHKYTVKQIKTNKHENLFFSNDEYSINIWKLQEYPKKQLEFQQKISFQQQQYNSPILDIQISNNQDLICIFEKQIVISNMNQGEYQFTRQIEQNEVQFKMGCFIESNLLVVNQNGYQLYDLNAQQNQLIVEFNQFNDIKSILYSNIFKKLIIRTRTQIKLFSIDNNNDFQNFSTIDGKYETCFINDDDNFILTLIRQNKQMTEVNIYTLNNK